MAIKKAMFGAGCFWGVQNYFEQVPGVKKVVVGYSGGKLKDPSYEDVGTDKTGHAEVVYLEYDPDKREYESLVRHFFRMHDPTQMNRQGPDIGTQYRSVIFYYDKEQKKTAEEIKMELDSDGSYKDEIVTAIEPAQDFFKAEEYHQDYVKKTGHGACHIAYAPIETDKK